MFKANRNNLNAPFVIYKNGGFGLNFANASLMLKIYKKTLKMRKLDDIERKRKTWFY